MWLTILNKPKNINEYEIHQVLWSFFQEHQRQGLTRPFCYFLAEDKIFMLSSIAANKDSKKIILENKETYLFECRASIRRTYKDENGKSKTREAYRGEELKEWFKRRFADCATINFVSYKEYAPHVVINPKSKNRMVFSQYVFSGSLTIDDIADFERICAKGVGQGCAFGFGAVVIPQVMK